MSWDEWVQHDAVALAARVRRGEVTPAELAAQAAAGVVKINPAVHAVVEVFDDVVADPLKDGLNPDGPFAGVPFFMKDLGPTMKGRLQEMGSLMMRGHRASADTFLTGKMRQAGLNLVIGVRSQFLDPNACAKSTSGTVFQGANSPPALTVGIVK